MAKYKISKKEGQCDREEWNKDTKQMKKCLCPTRMKRGNSFVCKDHLDYTLSMDSSPEMFGENGQFIVDKATFLSMAGAS